MIKSIILAAIFCLTVVSAGSISSRSNNDSMVNEDFDEWLEEWIDEWKELLGGFLLAGVMYFYNYIMPQIDQVISDFENGTVTFNTLKTMGKAIFLIGEFLISYFVGFICESALLIDELVKEIIWLIKGEIFIHMI